MEALLMDTQKEDSDLFEFSDGKIESIEQMINNSSMTMIQAVGKENEDDNDIDDI